MVTRFEHLSNDLLLEIIDYVNPRHLYTTFWNINFRLNRLLLSIKHLKLVIDSDENKECIAVLAPQTDLLIVNTWDDIDLSEFHHLHTLKLVRPSSIQLKLIRADIMPNLTYLLLSSNVNFSVPKQLISDAFSNRLPYLRLARLGHIDSYDGLAWSKSLSLYSLHIGCYHASMIPFILASCPNLQTLHVDFLRDNEKIINSPLMIHNHPLRKLILRDYCCILSYEDIINLMNYIPNTRKIELKFDSNVSFIVLIQYLANHLVNLQRFDCYITEYPIDLTTLTTIRQIHPCFDRITCQNIENKFRVFTTKK